MPSKFTTLMMLTSVAFAAACASPNSKAAPDISSSRPQSAMISGRQLFLNTCASCHGSDGQGGDGPSLVVINLDKLSVERIVRSGIPGEMPSFAKRFTQRQLDRLTGYVVNLQKHDKKQGG